jgi:hypothetical protein
MIMKIAMVLSGEVYIDPSCGWTMKREYETHTPNGNKMNGRWVLRDENDAIVDFDTYSNDIADRNNLALLGKECLKCLIYP